ncbi:MAG: hypothetical protein ABSD43_13760, partial [Terracidiphilus sp.]
WPIVDRLSGVVLEETWVAEMGIPTLPLKSECSAAGRKALWLPGFQGGLPGTVQDGRRWAAGPSEELGNAQASQAV